MSKFNIKAIGENVILISYPPKKGDQETTASGIILPALEQSELPAYCEVFSIGGEVPEGVIKLGDKTSVPTGAMKHVPHPDVIEGKKTQNEVRESFITVHWKNIPAVYGA
ncbi:gp31 head assembly cochaperone with GroEL [Acinetobacter phage Ac42]|uniref:head morphogenesis n=1 Tax=Acinetobacter phage Ac42 TaxID=762660 RepID=UPI0001EBCDFB|nr:head morphogenesis [Acinetobacter phage Ac42]ADI96447.1 gp31 head assembly cochaperone with GroEL [Acinetobacter phage Ac42]